MQHVNISGTPETMQIFRFFIDMAEHIFVKGAHAIESGMIGILCLALHCLSCFCAVIDATVFEFPCPHLVVR